MRRAALFLSLSLSLAGCATTARAPLPALDWDARTGVVQALPSWRMSGRVAIAVGAEGGSASVDWYQAGETADIRLSGPLGAGGLRAVAGADGFTLEDGRGEALRGVEAEALLADRLGVPVPWGPLRYWVLGAPAPGEAYQPVAPEGSGEAAFRQAGWTVGLAGFEPTASGTLLPTRLTVSRDGARLKLAVTRWELLP